MKSGKEIKDKTIVFIKIILGDKARVLWIMAIFGGFMAANLRQNGRLTLINQDDGAMVSTYDGDYEYYDPKNENLCGTMIRDFAKVNYEYRVEKGLITKEQIEKKDAERKKRIKKINERIEKGDTNVLFEDSEENKKSRETSAYIGRFVETCETTLGKKARDGYWPTVFVWSVFSWVGLFVASQNRE